MVFLSNFFYNIDKYSRKYSKRKFIDTLRLYVRGGTGGNGLPKRGGIGGKGGDVYIIGKEGIKLGDVVRKYSSQRILGNCGKHSEANRLLGDSGENIIIEVPLGVTAIDDYGRILGEIDAENSQLLVARGGPGGCAHTQFLGLRGQAHSITLDLKLIADVGLVGFPNAGKSSLLKAISRAKPKIASYPFTTIEPNIGVLQYNDFRQITMADLPGLIEGAHANVGMGHKFLKHVERTKMILMVVDINGFQLGPQYPHRSALETIIRLNKELELYNKDLLKKPVLLAINKMDSSGSAELWEELQRKMETYSNVVTECSADIRPEEPIEFCDIINLSVKCCNQSVLKLKDKIRTNIDLQVTNSGEEEINLRSRVKRKMLESGPHVI